MKLVFLLEELSMKELLEGLLPRLVDPAQVQWTLIPHEQAKYRNPDHHGSPSRALAELVPGYGKVSGARALGPRLDIERCRSPSFQSFVRAIRRATRGASL